MATYKIKTNDTLKRAVLIYPTQNDLLPQVTPIHQPQMEKKIINQQTNDKKHKHYILPMNLTTTIIPTTQT